MIAIIFIAYFLEQLNQGKNVFPGVNVEFED